MYRDNALPAAEQLHVFAVSTRRGMGVVVLLGVIAIFALVAAGVTIFAGAPPGVEPWKWPMVAIGVAALAGAIVRHHYRRRRLVITRTGDHHVLAIADENVELEFPLRLSGSQLIDRVNRIPTYHVFLKLSDARGRGVFLREVRGAIYGAQDGWFDKVDDSTPCEQFDATRAHMLVAVRDAVMAINSVAR